jgi:chromosome segregation ATPase
MKIKFLLVFLGIISLLGLGLAAWMYLSAQTEFTKYSRKRAELEKENTFLAKKLETTQKETYHWRGKSEAITLTLNKLGKEHVLLQNQYNALLEAKDYLFQENKGLSEQLERLTEVYSEQEVKPLADTTDEFLASLLEEKATLQVEIENLKGQIKQLEEQGRPSEEKLSLLEKEKWALEKKLSDFEKVSDLLSSDLLQEKKKRDALEKDLAKTESQLREIVLEKDNLGDQLDKMKLALEQRLAELEKTRQVLEGAVAGARQVARKTKPASIQLSPIVVKAEQQVPAETFEAAKLSRPEVLEEETFELRGRVITVNSRHKFVVVDIGRDDGVKKGMNFAVYRKGKEVGKIEVIETRKNIAACDIKEMSARSLKVNDTIGR